MAYVTYELKKSQSGKSVDCGLHKQWDAGSHWPIRTVMCVKLVDAEERL